MPTSGGFCWFRESVAKNPMQIRPGKDSRLQTQAVSDCSKILGSAVSFYKVRESDDSSGAHHDPDAP